MERLKLNYDDLQECIFKSVNEMKSEIENRGKEEFDNKLHQTVIDVLKEKIPDFNIDDEDTVEVDICFEDDKDEILDLTLSDCELVKKEIEDAHNREIEKGK